MQPTPEADTEHAFAQGAPLDSLEEKRAAASVASKLFGQDIPVEIGRFRVLDRIGAGGMGIVYAAWDPQLERRVAIKVVRLANDEERARKRLLAEARAAARLSHPNVVTVHDAGTADGRVWVAMEFVEGETLGDWTTTPRQPREVLEVFREAGRGLRAAHQAGLVHRDFKPANVLLSRDEAGRLRAQVADFGLAAVTEPVRDAPASESSELTGLTREGELLGTPAYMSPEQHLGDAADARSDQYSYCVALYQALHGHLPFEGDSVAQLREAVLGGKLPRGRVGRVPRRIDSALARGLSRDPSERFADMKALLDELAPRSSRARIAAAAVVLGSVAAVAAASATVEPLGALATPCEELDAPWASSLAHDLLPRLRDALATADVPAAAAIASAATSGLQTYHDRWLDSRTRVCRATHVDGAQSEALLDLRMGCLDVRRREVVAMARVIVADPGPSVVNAAVDAIEQIDPPERCEEATPDRNSPLLEGEEVTELREELLELQAKFRLQRYREGLERSRELVAKVRPLGHRRLLGLSLELLVAFASRTGKVDEANAHAQEALTLAIESRQPDLAADLAGGLVWLEGYVKGDYAAAERLGALALAWANAADYPRARATIVDNLGVVAFLAGDPALAERRHREAMTIEEPLREAYPATRVRHAINLSAALIEQGNVDKVAEAQTILQDAIALARRTYGDDHPSLASLLHNYALRQGTEYGCTHHMDDLERALAIKIANFGDNAVPVATTLSAVSVCRSTRGKYDAAAEGFAKVVEIRVRVGGPSNPQLRNTYLSWGRAEYERSDLTRAEELYREAEEVIRQSDGADSTQMHWVRFRLAEVTAARGDLDAAVEQVQAALELAEGSDPFPGDTATYRLALAQMLWEDEPERALALARRAADALADQPTEAELLAKTRAWLDAPQPWKPPG